MKKSRFTGRADHRDLETARGGREDGGLVPGAWDQRGDVLCLKSKYSGMDVAETQRLTARSSMADSSLNPFAFYDAPEEIKTAGQP